MLFFCSNISDTDLLIYRGMVLTGQCFNSNNNNDMYFLQREVGLIIYVLIST